MFSVRQVTMVGVVALVAGYTPVNAADLYGVPPGMKDTVPAYTSQPVYGPSWYARLDFSYGAYDDPTMIENGISRLIDTGIDSSWAVGGGIGGYFKNNFRGELTYEYRGKTGVTGTHGDPGAVFPNVARAFDMSSHLLMANLYYDFKNSSRFTPYIGVGLGAALHKTYDANISDGCGCTGTIVGEDKWSVAGALMAGVSMQLRGRQRPVTSLKDGGYITTPQRGLHIDIGYRFLYLGDATTGPITLDDGVNQVVSDDPTIEDLHAHEIRIGLRYDLN